jgi:hypothetical protein
VQRYYGYEFEIDLELCRLRLLERGAGLRMNGRRGRITVLVAKAAGVSEDSLRRFFEGGRLHAEKWTAIITQGLLLSLADVNVRLPEQEKARGVKPLSSPRAWPPDHHDKEDADEA